MKAASFLGVSDLSYRLNDRCGGHLLAGTCRFNHGSKKGESDLAVGNIIGSNLFNTLAVVGLRAPLRQFKSAMKFLT